MTGSHTQTRELPVSCGVVRDAGDAAESIASEFSQVLEAVGVEEFHTAVVRVGHGHSAAVVARYVVGPVEVRAVFRAQ